MLCVLFSAAAAERFGRGIGRQYCDPNFVSFGFLRYSLSEAVKRNARYRKAQ